MARKRTKVIGGIVAVLAVGGVVAANVAKDRRNRVMVQTQKVGQRDLVSIVTASGEVKPRKFVNVSSNVSGRIVQLLVREGERVRKGQVLARIDSTRFEADARQSEAGVAAQKAELDRAVADLEVARLQFERTERMHKEKLVSDQQFDQARADSRMKTANVESLKKRITQQEALLASRQDDLEKTVVVSPMDGVVTNLIKEEGEMVIGAQSFQPTVIMTVADLSVIECEVMVDETDIRNLKLGQEAEIRVDALEGVKIKGEVTEIGSSAIPRGQSQAAGASATNMGNQAKDFKVKITLKEPPDNIRPGLNAAADITTDRKEKVTAVPIQAVVVREINKEGKVVDPGSGGPAGTDGNPSPSPDAARRRTEEKEGVFVLAKDKVQFRPVTTGIVGETEIEIKDGLKEGEEIVTGSYRTLRTLKDQATVKVETKKDEKKS
jgi:HlyD family secretion protein